MEFGFEQRSVNLIPSQKLKIPLNKIEPENSKESKQLIPMSRLV